ncbi:MAG: hydroxypyruvate isomerase, partial [Verrucomicrobia bacterium]|nr:hydroxypyruvate isomerase [Verrucomicrobiota bacterium]
MRTQLSRRSALRKIAGASAAAAVTSSLSHRIAAAEAAVAPKLKGRINHSVCKWCYGRIPLEAFCVAAKEMGLQSVELLEVK